MKAPATSFLTGTDLKVMRVRSGVRLRDVAAGMGVSHQRVAQIESYARPSSSAIDRYIDALTRVADPRR